MSDTVVRHLIAGLGTLVALLAYISGYFSAGEGWWWTFLGVGVVYIIIYKLVVA